MIFIARTEFGISATELFDRLPAWEVDVLFGERQSLIDEAVAKQKAEERKRAREESLERLRKRQGE